MKIWFGHCKMCYDYDNDVKLGIGWFVHHKDHKWKGITFIFYLIFYRVDVTCVDNFKEYDKKINYRKYRDKK